MENIVTVAFGHGTAEIFGINKIILRPTFLDVLLEFVLHYYKIFCEIYVGERFQSGVSGDMGCSKTTAFDPPHGRK